MKFLLGRSLIEISAILILLICNCDYIYNYETITTGYISLLGNNLYDGPANIITSLSEIDVKFNLEKDNNKKENELEKEKEKLLKSREAFNLTIDNITYSINITKNYTECVPECYLNCQNHFPDPVEEKYCVINVCHCDMILNKTINMKTVILITDGNFNLIDTSLNKDIPISKAINSTTDYKLNEHIERHNYYVLMIVLMLLMLPPMIYFLIVMYKNWGLSEKIEYEFPYSINEYMLMGEFPEKEL